MSLYTLPFRLIQKPFVFDAGGYFDSVENQAFTKIFYPYVMGKDKVDCMERLHGTRVEMDKWPVLHMLAMLKANNNRYDPHMVDRLVTGVTDFLEHDWLNGNKLMREASRFVGDLHDKSHTQMSPSEFTGKVAQDMQRHFMYPQALREMFAPEDWLRDADHDRANAYLAQALIDNPVLQQQVFTGTTDVRFRAALRYYPREALEVGLDRGARWDQMLTRDLGL